MFGKTVSAQGAGIGYILHYHVGVVFELADVEDLNNGPVVKIRGGLRFGEQHLAGDPECGIVVTEYLRDLDGDVAVEKGIMAVIDNAHGAAPGDAENLVFANLLRKFGGVVHGVAMPRKSYKYSIRARAA